MSMITTEMLADIPYLDHATVPGRFLSCLTFYDEDWHFWMLAGEAGDTKLMKMKAWPAEAFYFAREAAEPNDVYLPFIDFMGRIACFAELQKPFSAVHDDVLNLSASLAKIVHLQSAKGQIAHGLSRMAATEVEYIVLVCRSLFDLFQEMLLKIWDRVQLIDATAKKKPLKESFARTIMSGNTVLTAEEIAERFGIPLELAQCYERASETFIALRRFRDNIVHHGSPMQHIFEGDGAFLISSRFRPFPNMDVWADEERQPNDLVPLLPALQMLVYRTIMICDDFCVTLSQQIGFPPPIVPDMVLFSRGYFAQHLIEALQSGAARSRVAPAEDTTGGQTGADENPSI